MEMVEGLSQVAHNSAAVIGVFVGGLFVIYVVAGSMDLFLT
jgi:hypothetical protein